MKEQIKKIEEEREEIYGVVILSLLIVVLVTAINISVTATGPFFLGILALSTIILIAQMIADHVTENKKENAAIKDTLARMEARMLKKKR